MILLDADGISVSRPDRPLFTDLSLTVESDDRLGVVGINGCGKSTLLLVLAGLADPDAGTVRRSRDVRVAVLDQNPDFGAATAFQAVTAGVSDAGSWEANAVLQRLGVAELAEMAVSSLSGGQAKRVALARALLLAPGDHDADVLILDEPTNHLDLDAIEWLEARLAVQKGAVILVTHDRHLLDRVATSVLEIDRGRGYLHARGYKGYLDGRAAREEQASSTESSRRNLARRELAWLRRGAPARTRKPKAHIESATAVIETRAQAPARAGALGLGAATSRSGEGQGPRAGSQGSYRNAYDARLAPRLGNKVIELHGVACGWPGGDGPVLEHVDWNLEPGGRYGIVGPNGAGKTTLLEVMAGRLEPTAGRIEVGPTVRVGYYTQMGRDLDGSARVREAVAGPARPPGTPEDKRLMEQFWFDDDGQWARIESLSGGERRRLQLLLVLAERPNVLLLDEPTNDLDLDTLRAFEELLEEWPGTAVAVSHDRAFLDRTTEEVLLVDGGRAGLVAGGYAGWRASRDRSNAPAGQRQRSASMSSGGVSPEGSRPASTSASTPASTPARTASTLRHLIRETDRELVRAEKEHTALQASITGADRADHVRLGDLTAKLAAADVRLRAAEERWLELSSELEGSRR